jgi:hypothetical protein
MATRGKQSTRDAGTLLPIVAAILFLPPLTLIFSAPIAIAGLPLILVYLFTAWALVIAAACFLASRLEDIGVRQDEAPSQPGDDISVPSPDNVSPGPRPPR